MAEQAGSLHWNRRRLTLAAGFTDIDTGIITPNLAYGTLEPPLGVSAASSPPFGTEPASRVQVVPMVPTNSWAGVAHGEPYVSTIDGHVHVTFENTNEGPVDINVLFWNPHTVFSPGQADTYAANDGCEDCTTLDWILRFVNDPGRDTMLVDVQQTQCALIISLFWDPTSLSFAPALSLLTDQLASYSPTIASTTGANQFSPDNWNDVGNTSQFNVTIACANPAIFDADNFVQVGAGIPSIILIDQGEEPAPDGTLTGTITITDEFVCCP